MENNECECLRCGWIWNPRRDSPKRCPGCQNPRWNIPLGNKKLNQPPIIIRDGDKRPESI